MEQVARVELEGTNYYYVDEPFNPGRKRAREFYEKKKKENRKVSLYHKVIGEYLFKDEVWDLIETTDDNNC